MKKRLLKSARFYQENEDSLSMLIWRVFNEDNNEEFILDLFQEFYRNSHLVYLNSHQFYNNAASENWLKKQGEPKAFGAYYSEDFIHNQVGCILVFEESGTKQGSLIALNPIFQQGVLIKASIENIILYESRLEACLCLSLSGCLLNVYDGTFWLNREKYLEKTLYRFRVSGIAYSIERVTQEQAEKIIISDPALISKINATRGIEDEKPIEVLTGELHSIYSHTDYLEYAVFRGRVECVIPDYYQFLGVNFWRIHVCVLPEEAEHEKVTIPIHVSEYIIPDNWPPQVGEFVSGIARIQVILDGVRL